MGHDNLLLGKTAIVTGASRGIGAEVARHLAARGVRVALVARRQDLLESIASEIGGDSFAVPCDLMSEDSVVQMLSVVRSEFSAAPDILVNNAGIFGLNVLEKVSMESFMKSVGINLHVPFRMIREFVGDMKSRGSGHIVNIGSVSDRVIMPENGPYSAAKYGLRALTEVLRAETRGTGVRVTLVSPSATDTELWDELLSNLEGRSLPPRTGMLPVTAVAEAVTYAVSQPDSVNIEELRLSHS